MSEPMQYTITAWVKKASVTSTSPVIYAEENSALERQTKLLYWGENFGNGNVKLRIYQDGSNGVTNNDSFDSGIALTDTDWHHIAWVQTSTTSYDVYVDGVKKGTKRGVTLSGTFTPDSNNIGSRPNNSQFYSGQIDELLIFNKELTASEIAGLAGL